MILSNWIDPFAPADGAPPRTLWRFFGWALRGAWAPLIVAGIIAISGGVLEILSAMVLGWVVDAVVETGPQGFFASEAPLLLGALAFFLLARPVVFGATAYMQSVVVQPGVLNLCLSRLHRYTLGQAVTFFDDDYAGRIAQKEMQTATALNDVVLEVLQTVLFALASVVGALWLLTTVDWRVAGIFALWMVGYGFFIRYFIPKIRARARTRAGARANVTGQIVDTVTNIRTVKLFAHADHEDRAALGAMATYRARFIEFGLVAAAFRFWLMTLAGLLPVLLVGGALLAWTQGGVTAGEITATGAVSIRLAQMTGWVTFAVMGLYANLGEVEDGIRTLTPPHRLVDAAGAPDMAVTDGAIDLRAVRFGYGRNEGGVQGIDLHIAPGEKVGVVGASGAGKSTLVALLLRLYDTEEGAIEIDGQNVSHVTQESLRRQIGMVTQDTAMFNRSAMDNIRYGRPDATDDEVFEAARKAEAHAFILKLQDGDGRQGYAAHLGERGVKLSGGQKQRIALARAILKDAPILVLDEATSALDSEVEAQIQRALTNVMQGKTVLAIAHRLSTIADMDRIVVMEAGRIAEQGTHDDLLARDGLYAQFWALQSGGFLGDGGAREAAE